MDKILEALKKLLPADSVNEVASAVDEMLNEARTEIEAEFNDKLEEAYKELSGELATAEKTAEQGYQEAYTIISDLRNRLDVQREEFESTLEEGYEEAYQMLLAERAKSGSIETEIYDEYDKRLAEMKEYIVEKVDQFLQFKGAEIYEQAKRDVLNDPRMAEHKVALDKIVEITTNYLSDEDVALATSSKLDEAYRSIEKLQADVRMMEARNIRLDHDNRKLNEAVRHTQNVLTEGRNSDRKERAQKARNVSGRGHSVPLDETRVIAEHNSDTGSAKEDDTDVSTLLEGIDLRTINTLAGTGKKQKS